MLNLNVGMGKTAKQMERHLKGMSNHYRIAILLLLVEREGIILEEIIEALRANPKTVGEHVRRLARAGLIDKEYRGHCVEHRLSPYGKSFAAFLKSFQNA